MRRDKLGFDNITDYENESYSDIEGNLKDFLEKLNIQGIQFEKAHETSKRNYNSPRKIVPKLSSYKAKEYIHRKASSLKGTGCLISEGFSKDILDIRKKNWQKRWQI